VQLRLPHQSLRPATRPHQSAGRLWWRYAFKAVLNQLQQGRPSWWDLAAYLRIQREYVPLYVRLLKDGIAAAQNDPKIQHLDRELPDKVMLHFRKMAHAQVRRSEKESGKKGLQKSTQRSWVGWALGYQAEGVAAAEVGCAQGGAGALPEGTDVVEVAAGGTDAVQEKERSYLTAAEVQALEDMVQAQVHFPPSSSPQPNPFLHVDEDTF
jgi:hypothetical protein